MTDIATLGLKIDSSGAVKATKDLDKLEKQSGKTEKTAISMGKAFGAAGVAAASAFAFNALQINREFESLRTSLITTTGSAENAAVAFEGIQQFAAKTPFAVAELTNAFIKLGNLGLAPSERALTSYGNTAGAMGKSLNQVVEAVADATTGEFERLKEFGIKSKSEGDRVIFTFRGVKTEIGKNAKEIQDYLIRLGETEFAGGMAKQSATINGAISNLGDSWDAFLDNLLNSEAESKVARAFAFLGQSIDWLDAKINGTVSLQTLINESDQLNANIKNYLDALRQGKKVEIEGFTVDGVVDFKAAEKRLAELQEKIWMFGKESKDTFDTVAESLNKVGSSESIKIEFDQESTVTGATQVYMDYALRRIEANEKIMASQTELTEHDKQYMQQLSDRFAEEEKQQQKAMDARVKASEKHFDALERQAERWSESFADAMVDAGSSFEDFTSGVLKQMQKIAIQKATQPLFSAFSGFLDSFDFSKLLSFDGGGTTGSGSRTGGVDGKGGFPAILHPNETVVDHTKGQGGNVSVVVNVDASGTQAQGDNVDLGRVIGDAVRVVLLQERRPGGLLT